MGQDDGVKKGPPEVVESPRQFFAELVESAVDQRRIKALPFTKNYIVDLLGHFMLTVNLFESASDKETGKAETLAEMYLRANISENPVRQELLKKLGDTALYVSGFFGDSLHRKLVDIDYYVEMGGTAYGVLAASAHEDMQVRLYKDLSHRFVEYVDLLTYISQKALVQTDADILRLYNRYLATGSKLAEEQLIEQGVLAVANNTRSGRH